MTNPYTLEGRTALVTGGAQGIGAAIAQGLVEAGARVFVCDRNAEIGEATAKDL
ncbi:3-oxoacyl-ACP reductase, partial [Streptomyces regensis]